jgi:hypothetical protein
LGRCVALAYAVAVFEASPGNWLRAGVIEDCEDLLATLKAPAPKSGGDPIILNVARRNVRTLLNEKARAEAAAARRRD